MIPGLNNVYKDIVDRIALIKENDLPVFNTVAVFNDQINRSKSGKGYSFWDPSVFIEIRSSNDGSFGEQLTFSDLDIIFHISMFQLNGWDQASLDENLYIFHLRNLIKSNFSMFKPTQCGLFNWDKEEQQFDHDQIYTYKLTYKCHYIDQVAYPFNTGQYYYATASLTLIAQYGTASILEGIGYWIIGDNFVVS